MPRWPFRLFASSWCVLLLAGCAFLPPRSGAGGTALFGTRVSYVFRDRQNFAFCNDDRVGCTIPLGSVCVVQIDPGYFGRSSARARVLLVAHEVGHCLDLRVLGLSHGGFRDEGRRWGPYWSVPSEGFAEAYARVYLSRCGPDLRSLGWMNEQGPCPPPDPHEVTPRLIETQRL